MPLFVGDELSQYTDLTVGLSRVLFPVVVILGLNGLVVGILNAYDHFTIPALSPLVWNAVILLCLVGSQQVLTGDDQLYGYAIGILVGHRSSSSRWRCRCCASSASTCRSPSPSAISACARSCCSCCR